jgi:predicted MPP superfamily phosphohydrolase
VSANLPGAELLPGAGLLLGAALAGLLLADTLRRVYAVGKEANDHFVAVVVSACMGLYGLQWVAAPQLWPAWVAGMVGLWGLFFCLHRDRACPRWLVWGLAWPSQLAYAFALWAGLTWLIRAPIAWGVGSSVLWAGPWLLLPLALAILGCIHARVQGQRITHHSVPGLPGRVVQLSDLHASPLMAGPELQALVAQVNALEPALVLITGDQVMPFSEAQHDYLIQALEGLEAPSFCCAGNHDLPVLDTLRAELEPVAPMLVDEGRQSGSFYVYGVNFHWKSAREELEKSVVTLGGEGFRILMAHDPRLGAWIRPEHADLVLSGHTHGGQVGLNMLGLRPTLLGLFGVRDQGWFREGVPQYVHAGSWWIGLPPRMGVAGEIAVFEPAAKDD